MTFPLDTLAATIDANGISAPPYTDIYQSFQASLQQIYGPDFYLAPDSQDGQLIAIVAKAISDCNDVSIAIYNAYRPSGAQGAGLSSLVKINGIARLVPSNSQVDLMIVGEVGVGIQNGIAADANQHQWALPALVTIPPAGFIIVTATCTTPGAIEAAVGAVNQIATPTRGWQSVTNPSVASTGAPVETDAALRKRQTESTEQPSTTVLAGTLGAVKNVVGVTQAVIYENDTNTTDADGIPPHSIAVVVIGGDSTAIATAIMLRKTPGTGTYGTTTIPVMDDAGVVHNISFFVPTVIAIKAAITIRAFAGYAATTGTALKQAVADYINALPIGQDVFRSRLYLPAQLYGGAGSEQYELQVLQIAQVPNPVGDADVPVAFNARATCSTADIILTVV
jgi:uncharacterized phage protein gp47/JayE